MAVRGLCGARGSAGCAGGWRRAGGGLCHRILLETQAGGASLTEQFSRSAGCVVDWDAVNLAGGMDAQRVPRGVLGSPLVSGRDARGREVCMP